jgi:gliding motility-associated lipoprotein GldH
MNRYALLFYLAFVIVGCGSKVILDKEETVPSDWTKSKNVPFELVVEDTSKMYEILLDLNTAVDFQFENLYVKLKTKFPDNKIIEDLVSFEINDKNGEPLGKCSSSVCNTPIVLQERIKFPQLGTYSINLEQHSRLDTLNGVLSMRIKVSEVNLN